MTASKRARLEQAVNLTLAVVQVLCVLALALTAVTHVD